MATKQELTEQVTDLSDALDEIGDVYFDEQLSPSRKLAAIGQVLDEFEDEDSDDDDSDDEE